MNFIYFFLVAFIAREYKSVPAMAILDPMMDPVDIGVLKATTDATMITTRLMVFPTACVTGLTFEMKSKKFKYNQLRKGVNLHYHRKIKEKVIFIIIHTFPSARKATSL